MPFYGVFDAKGTLVEIDPVLYSHYVKIHELGIIVSDETYSMEICRSYFKDRIFFDIGSYMGLWSVFAVMNGAKHVYAFDPVLDDLVPTQYTNYTRFTIPLDDKVNTIDKMSQAYGVPGIIKIDVEGDEVHILRGAKDTLKSKPVLMVEVHPGYREGVLEILGKPVKEMPQSETEDFTHMFYNI